MTDFKSILVAIDLGDTWLRAYDTAIDLASRLRVPLEIVHVCAPSTSSVAAQARLAQLVEEAGARGVMARAHLEEETPVVGLLACIDRVEPMMVVVGSHGRHGLQRAIHGSVSDALARKSPVPVLVVPAITKVEEPIYIEPAPAAGESVASDLDEMQTRDPASTFAISPPGTEGYDVNPELRVRY
jgi:nucleotide-binding universal stress UspA family protein